MSSSWREPSPSHLEETKATQMTPLGLELNTLEPSLYALSLSLGINKIWASALGKNVSHKGLQWVYSLRSGMPKPLSRAPKRTWRCVLGGDLRVQSRQTSPQPPSLRETNHLRKVSMYQEVRQSTHENTISIKETSSTRAPFFSPWPSFLTTLGEKRKLWPVNGTHSFSDCLTT